MTTPVTTIPPRAAGFLAIATGIAALALLAFHPDAPAHSFADVLRNEAASRMQDAVVHGGFIMVLALQLTCYAVFAARLPRLSGLMGFIFFAVGTGFLAASMLIDGLVVPAVAAKYLPVPEKIEYAKSLFALLGILIGFLMPLGLGFQSAAMAAWGWALIATRASRIAGLFGLIVGSVLTVAIVASFMAMNPFVVMGGVAATAIWAMVAGVVLLNIKSTA